MPVSHVLISVGLEGQRVPLNYRLDELLAGGPAAAATADAAGAAGAAADEEAAVTAGAATDEDAAAVAEAAVGVRREVEDGRNGTTTGSAAPARRPAVATWTGRMACPNAVVDKCMHHKTGKEVRCSCNIALK